MNGLLIIDKSSGPTSHDVVAAVRKTLGIRKVGHTGTLDPAATGVLPLVLGKATKLARYLSGADKTYRARVRLGVTTDTHDAQGTVQTESPVDLEPSAIEAALMTFVGETEQIPPMYSAKKIDGKRLYELARQGVEVEREAKLVSMHSIDIIEISGADVTFDLACSSGTYVRVLAHDLGQALGCGAHLAELRRTSVGPLGLDQAITLEALADEPEQAADCLIPVAQALTALPTIDVPSDIARMIKNGYQLSAADLRRLDTPTFEADVPLALRLDSGDLIAVARTLVNSAELESIRRDKRALKTERVLA